MPSYRYFKFEPNDRHRLPGEWVDAHDDDQAMALVRQLAGDSRCEVWLKNKLVGVVVPQV